MLLCQITGYGQISTFFKACLTDLAFSKPLPLSPITPRVPVSGVPELSRWVQKRHPSTLVSPGRASSTYKAKGLDIPTLWFYQPFFLDLSSGLLSIATSLFYSSLATYFFSTPRSFDTSHFINPHLGHWQGSPCRGIYSWPHLKRFSLINRVFGIYLYIVNCISGFVKGHLA